MLQMALQLAQQDEVYSDMAGRFLDHYLNIVKDINEPEGRANMDGLGENSINLDSSRYNLL